MWKKNLIYFLIILTGIVIQTSAMPALFSGNFVPQVMLVLAMATTIVLGFSNALIWIIISGLLLDFFSYSIIGKSIIILVLAAYLVSFFSRRFLVESKGWSFAVMFLFVAVATLLHRVIIFSNFFIGGHPEARSFEPALSYLGSEMVCNEILFFLFFFAMKKADKLSFAQSLGK